MKLLSRRDHQAYCRGGRSAVSLQGEAKRRRRTEEVEAQKSKSLEHIFSGYQSLQNHESFSRCQNIGIKRENDKHTENALLSATMFDPQQNTTTDRGEDNRDDTAASASPLLMHML